MGKSFKGLYICFYSDGGVVVVRVILVVGGVDVFEVVSVDNK